MVALSALGSERTVAELVLHDVAHLLHVLHRRGELRNRALVVAHADQQRDLALDLRQVRELRYLHPFAGGREIRRAHSDAVAAGAAVLGRIAGAEAAA
jgi:hypothetical protein